MNNNYSISEVTEVDKLLNYLLLEHSITPDYLKETLREIRKLVDKANIQADELVNQKRLEDFDVDLYLDIIHNEFPNLKWTSNKVAYGAVVFTGKVGVLEVRIDYDPSYEKKWDINTIDFGEDIYTCLDESSRCGTLHEAIKLVKDYLLPIQSTLQQLNLT